MPTLCICGKNERKKNIESGLCDCKNTKSASDIGWETLLTIGKGQGEIINSIYSNNSSCACGDSCQCKVDNTPYKYNENKNIEEFAEYIKSTYDAHYNTDSNMQAIDAWKALGSLLTSSRDVAIKYLWRIGKKGNKEDFKKDIFKVMHYSLFMLHALSSKE